MDPVRVCPDSITETLEKLRPLVCKLSEHARTFRETTRLNSLSEDSFSEQALTVLLKYADNYCTSITSGVERYHYLLALLEESELGYHAAEKDNAMLFSRSEAAGFRRDDIVFPEVPSGPPRVSTRLSVFSAGLPPDAELIPLPWSDGGLPGPGVGYPGASTGFPPEANVIDFNSADHWTLSRVPRERNYFGPPAGIPEARFEGTGGALPVGLPPGAELIPLPLALPEGGWLGSSGGYPVVPVAGSLGLPVSLPAATELIALPLSDGGPLAPDTVLPATRADFSSRSAVDSAVIDRPEEYYVSQVDYSGNSSFYHNGTEPDGSGQSNTGAVKKFFSKLGRTISGKFGKT